MPMVQQNPAEQIQSRLNDGREYRAMTLEVRASGENSEYMVDGYATTFNQPYVLYEGRGYKYLEQVAATAFDGCDMEDVIFQFDHRGMVYARIRNKTLTLAVDGHGLKVSAYLGGTEEGRRLYEQIKGGYIDRMSFGFIVAEDTELVTHDDVSNLDTILRTITKIKKLFDVSAVSIPANDMTDISARNRIDGVIDAMEAERLRRARIITTIQILTEVTNYAH